MGRLIKIGDLELTKFTTQAGIQGLSIPTIRTSSGDYAGTDGGYIDGQYYSSRTITIDGFIIGSSSIDLSQKRQALINALPIRQLLPVRISNDDGNTYYLEAYVTNFKMDFDAGVLGEFEITLTAPDPYIYLDNYIETEIFKIVGGGYVVPMIFPYIYEAGTNPVIINNTSNIYVYPIIELNGKFTNPKISNVVTGDYIKLTTSTSSGDLIEIDTKNRTVVLNGGSILPSKSGSWINIAPGGNTFRLDSDSNDDNGTCFMKYRIGVLGI